MRYKPQSPLKDEIRFTLSSWQQSQQLKPKFTAKKMRPLIELTARDYSQNFKRFSSAPNSSFFYQEKCIDIMHESNGQFLNGKRPEMPQKILFQSLQKAHLKKTFECPCWHLSETHCSPPQTSIPQRFQVAKEKPNRHELQFEQNNSQASIRVKNYIDKIRLIYFWYRIQIEFINLE